MRDVGSTPLMRENIQKARVSSRIVALLSLLACVPAIMVAIEARRQCDWFVQASNTNVYSAEFKHAQYFGYYVATILSGLQFLIAAITLLFAFCRDPRSPRLVWFFIAAVTVLQAIGLIWGVVPQASKHTPDAVFDPAPLLGIASAIVVLLWGVPTIILSLKIAFCAQGSGCQPAHAGDGGSSGR